MLKAKSIRQRVNVEFTLNGSKESVELEEPTVGQASKLRTAISGLAKNEDNPSEDPLGEVHAQLANCVKLCVPEDQVEGEMKDEDWVSLVLRSGGERSPLVKESLKLCGMGRFDADVKEAQDPTPFS